MRQVILWIGRLLMLSVSVVVLVGFAHYSGLKKSTSATEHPQKEIFKMMFYGVASKGEDPHGYRRCQRQFTHPIKVHFKKHSATVNGHIFLEKITWRQHLSAAAGIYFNGEGELVHALTDDQGRGRDKAMLAKNEIDDHRFSFHGIFFNELIHSKDPSSPHGLGYFSTASCRGYFSLSGFKKL